MTKSAHEYTARLIWDGNTGEGTTSYASYGRQYRVLVAGKPDLSGTADPAFRGEADKHNPEDLFLTSISACHMLFYLSLCARQGVRVLAYEDTVQGSLAVDVNGGGKFETITLHPHVTIAADADLALAEQLHDKAHELCFIANSCSVPIRHQVTVQTG
ncbi:MAG: OsmC family protein [Anaerolineae bacterium]|nr:OsmC family protein [Gemmatimonadaceae bacterium]